MQPNERVLADLQIRGLILDVLCNELHARDFLDVGLIEELDTVNSEFFVFALHFFTKIS